MTESSELQVIVSKRTSWYFWFAIFFPTVLTAVYFVLLSKAATLIQNGTYGIGKFIQFALPVWFVYRVAGEKIRPTLLSGKGVGLGMGFGLAVFVLMVLIFEHIVKYAPEFTRLREMVIAKTEGFGLSSFGGYLGLSVFYCVIHSGLEEYYWRSFVFKRLTETQSMACANAISSVGFTLHHVLLLGAFFQYSSIFTYLFSVAIGIGGAFWAWLYHRSSNIYAAWISHAIIDAALFYIGYGIICGDG